MVIYLVRHAHAGAKHAWKGPDGLRPISRAGWREVAGLLAQLRGAELSAVLSSPATRCVQTVDRIAAEHGLTVATDARLGPDSTQDQFLALIAELGRDGEDGRTLLCSHGEVIGVLLAALRDRGAPIPASAEWPKGSTWILDGSAGAVTGAHYLPPVRVDEPAAYHG
jgi:8-oxo-dGTP diphosphatase